LSVAHLVTPKAAGGTSHGGLAVEDRLLAAWTAHEITARGKRLDGHHPCQGEEAPPPRTDLGIAEKDLVVIPQDVAGYAHRRSVDSDVSFVACQEDPLRVRCVAAVDQ
jgi:hypothetical protein